jgi:predicted anti-sigma-YlaC factor YlaD
VLSCKEIIARHSEFLDGEMTPPDTERWRAHLKECATCARYDRVLRKGVKLLGAQEPEPHAEPEFLMHLRYRLADEERRMVSQPISPSAGLVFSLAAVIALVISLPPMFTVGDSPGSAVRVNALESYVQSAEIAWHGGLAMNAEPSHVALPAPSPSLQPVHAINLVDPGYSPLVIKPPTAPLSYTR